MNESPYATERDDAYRAIGRYVVEFSRLIFDMRLVVIYAITGGLGNDMHARATIALGEVTAHPIHQAFFALCRLDSDLDEEESRIASKLEEAVGKEITRRNDYAHGDWWVGWGDGPVMNDPSLWRIKPGRKQGAFDLKTIPTEQLDRASDEVTALRGLVTEFGHICVNSTYFGVIPPELRIRDVFGIKGSRRSGHVIRKPDAPVTPLRPLY